MKLDLKKALGHGVYTVEGIMIKVQAREHLTVPEEEYLYHHGTPAQVSEAFRHYPIDDVK